MVEIRINHNCNLGVIYFNFFCKLYIYFFTNVNCIFYLIFEKMALGTINSGPRLAVLCQFGNGTVRAH
jgi:hypothetical protein